jgi:hypothetical protein
LFDVAPTVAALLGVPAPRHAEGRALVELLAMSPGDARRRAASDVAHGLAVIAAAGHTRAPAPARLVVVAIGTAIAIATAYIARRRGALVVARGALAGTLGLAVMAAAIVALTRGRLSPSYVPSLARTLQLGGTAAVIAIVSQVVVSRRVIRRAGSPAATANALALVGLTTALTVTGALRAWFSPPFLDVPPPLWMVVVPTADLAAATCALAIAITLALPTRDRAAPSR